MTYLRRIGEERVDSRVRRIWWGKDGANGCTGEGRRAAFSGTAGNRNHRHREGADSTEEASTYEPHLVMKEAEEDAAREARVVLALCHDTRPYLNAASGTTRQSRSRRRPRRGLRLQ